MEAKNAKNITLDEIVFEGRNKAYGAYSLRKNYSRYLTRAALIGIGIFGGALMAAWAVNRFSGNKDEDLQSVEIDLSKLKEEKQEEKKPDIPPPPPEPEPPKPEVAQIKFIPPEPKADEEVKNEEPPPVQEELVDKQISKENKEGIVSDEIAPDPPPVEAPKPAEIEQPKEEEIFTTVEQNPEFPGGIKEMYAYIGKNLKYPSAAQRANVSGKVFAKFVVERDGRIGDVQILKGIGFGCDEEAQRVIKSMPKWNPGKQNGRSVRVFFTMPINFQLE